MGIKPIERQRQKIVPLAAGNVLEIGSGSGLNFSHYNGTHVTHLWALEPSSALRQRAKHRAETLTFDVTHLDAGGEAIPLGNGSIDSVVMTYALCTIPRVTEALEEMRRVLKPDGVLYFSEHSRSPHKWVHRTQRLLNPLWHRLAGGCQLERPTRELLNRAGFVCDDLSSLYLPGPRWLNYHVWGEARPELGAGSGRDG
jgi:ubiquinone/menaquinone biosynthesis C-methylase UbiE